MEMKESNLNQMDSKNISFHTILKGDKHTQTAPLYHKEDRSVEITPWHWKE